MTKFPLLFEHTFCVCAYILYKSNISNNSIEKIWTVVAQIKIRMNRDKTAKVNSLHINITEKRKYSNFLASIVVFFNTRESSAIFSFQFPFSMLSPFFFLSFLFFSLSFFFFVSFFTVESYFCC